MDIILIKINNKVIFTKKEKQLIKKQFWFNGGLMIMVYTIFRSIKRSETSINPPFYETSFLRGLFYYYTINFNI